MPRRVDRERLLVGLRQRHRLSLIALEAPAGYGRTVLLEQALAEGPGHPTDRDVLYRCGPDDARLEHLVRGLVEACIGPSSAPRHRMDDVQQSAGCVAAALEAAAGPTAQVALVVDNAERAGDAAGALWSALLPRLSAHRHLVLSGRRLPPVDLARQVAAGTGLLIDASDLAFRPDEVAKLGEPGSDLTLIDTELASWPALASLVLRGRPELVQQFMTESVLEDLDPALARALAAVAAVGGCPEELLAAVVGPVALPMRTGGPGSVAAMELDPVLSDLAILPLVQAREGCWPHPAWADATRSTLTAAERSRAIGAKALGQVRAGAVNEAGGLALRTKDRRALALVVRGALASLPPSASVSDLRAWSESDLLLSGSAEHSWLAGVLDLQTGDTSGIAQHRLERARQAFEEAGDEEGEGRVLLYLGAIARSGGDTAELGRLLLRAEDLAGRGNPVARGLVAMGRAVTAQLAGDHEGAIRSLDGVPPGSLVGEWGGQVLMVRGTNLLLAGRTDAAIVALDAATGEGTPASRAVAHDLLATARWYAEDPVGAVADADVAESLALAASPPAFARLVRSARACMLAATGQRTRALEDLDRLNPSVSDATADEASTLARLAEVLQLAEDGHLDRARSLLESTTTIERTVRSSVWKAALDSALLPDTRPEAGDTGALGRARQAGRAAAAHLAGGPRAGREHRPFLPSGWCETSRAPITITLTGPGQVERDFKPVHHPAWGRARVRELCLHLALVEDKSRSAVAADLWPDRGDRSAGQNLRVTLSHLLDVLDPERGTLRGSPIVDGDGPLRFNRDAGLHIDLWDMHRHARAITTIPAHERPSLLAHARRLIRMAPGPVLGGVGIGEWFEPYRRALDDQAVAAALVAGGHALGAGDYELAEALGRLAVSVDSWSERAYALIIEARLDRGDADGARRALLHAAAVMEELAVSPGPALAELGYRVGLSHGLIANGRSWRRAKV